MKNTAEKLHRRVGRKWTMLRKQRVRYGLMVKEVAEQVGVDQSFLSLLENGKRKPSLDVAKRLAAFYETTIEELFV